MPRSPVKGSIVMNSHLVLVVAGDTYQTRVMTRLLLIRGYGVELAGDHREAIEKLVEKKHQAILIDDDVRGPDDRHLYDQIVEICPECVDRVVFLVDDQINEQAKKFFADSGRPSLTRPFRMEKLDELMADNDPPWP